MLTFLTLYRAVQPMLHSEVSTRISNLNEHARLQYRQK